MKTRCRFSLLAFVIAALGSLVPTQAHALVIQRLKLSNGAVLLLSEQHQLPMVTVAIAFDAGSRRDPAGKEGLAALTAESLAQGTKELSANEFNQKVDFMGSSLSVTADRDFAEAAFTSLKRYEPETMRLLTAVIQSPGLRDADVLRKRAEQIAGLKAANERPGYVAEVTFSKVLFGDGPYGHSPEGSVESVAKLAPNDVRDFYRTHYGLGNAVIVVVGDVTTAEIKGQLENELLKPSGRIAAESAPVFKLAPGVHFKLINRDVAQANLILGFAGIARSDPDYYRCQVMNYILGGGGFASRLMQQVRSKAGLAYSIRSGVDAGKFPGSFAIVLQTKDRSANDALGMIGEQLRELRTRPVAAAELDSAKKFLIGSFPLKLDRQSSIAGFMLGVELYGLGLDYADRYPKLIQSVTADQVREMASKYLNPDAIVLVAVANEQEAHVDAARLSGRGQTKQ